MSTASESEAATFLRALWPDVDGWLLVWGIPSKRSAWFQSISDDMLTTIDTMATVPFKGAADNVYIGCALRGSNLGPTLRGGRADCTAIPGVWLDLDYGSEHKKPNLPPTQEDAEALLSAMGLPPSAVIHSGRGLQAWWFFREPWTFDSDEGRVQAEALTKGWSSTLRAKAVERGWDADQVGDLPRVMRIPGTWNRKGAPKRVKLESCDADRRYNPSDFEPYLLVEAQRDAPSPKLTWAFEMNPLAEPPADKFMRLCEVDSKFRLSWEHARSDLQEQSASAYDLSLATRALAAGWSTQELVNLIIAHRRKYGDQPEKAARRDYLEATLNKAVAGKNEEARQRLVEGIQAGEALPDDVQKDPAEILALLSVQLGVKITKFVRYRSTQNSYHLEINGRLINVPSVDILDNQTAFRRLILDHTDVRIRSFPAKATKHQRDEWATIVQQLFLAVENEDVKAATAEGLFENWINLYLGNDGAGRAEDWQKAACDYRPFTVGGELWIVGEGLRKFLVNSLGERITEKELAVKLAKLGLAYHRKWVRGKQGGKSIKTSRGCWCLGSADRWIATND